MNVQPRTIPSHTFETTSDKNILRFVDRDGNWTHYWIKNRRMYVPAVNHIIRVGYPKGERFYNYLLRSLPEEAERKLRTAGEEGARSHDAIRDLIMGDMVDLDRRYYNELSNRYEPLTPEEWDNLEAFVAWSEKYKPRMLRVESAVWSEVYKYAGTLDFLGTISIPEGDKMFTPELWGNDIFILIDWKTSSGIWDEYEIQVAAYRQAVLEHIKAKMPLERYSGLWTGIVRLGTNHKNGYEMKVWNERESDINFELFLSALDIYKKKSGVEFQPEMRNIPAEFRIQIPKLHIRRARKTRPVEPRPAEKTFHENPKEGKKPEKKE